MATAPIEVEKRRTIDPELMRAIADCFQVPDRMPLTEWSEKYRILPQEEAKGGLYRVSNTPWNREIMDRLSMDDPCTEVVFMKSTQIGATELGNNWLGQVIHQEGGRFLSVFPTAEMARRNMRTRIAPMIAATPELRDRVAKPNSREGANTLLEKEFKGGMLVSTGASSGVGLRSIAAQRCAGDEFEAWPADVDKEGDPLLILKRRMDSYGDNKKLLLMSTPKEQDTSRVEPMYLASDRNKFYVPCPHCNHSQNLVWDQVRMDKDKDGKSIAATAGYVCIECKTKWNHAEKVHATREGSWIPEREWEEGMPRGYFINAIYSHTVKLTEMAQEWIDAQTHIEKLIVFVNTRLGETWKDQSIYSYDADKLQNRAEVYEFECPDGVQVITGGVDVQDNRLELEVLGWGYQEECWSLGHYVFEGDTSVWGDPWTKLTEQLQTGYQGRDKVQYVSAVAIDSGHHTNMVYAYCLRREPGRTNQVWPIKGAVDNYGPLWGKRPERNSIKKLRPYMVNVYEIKKSFYARLNMPPGGAGTFHFSTQPFHDRDWMEQLTSESLATKRHAGRMKKEWVVRSGVRNEVLDCVVYAFAAVKGMLKGGFKFKRMTVAPPVLVGDTSEPESEVAKAAKTLQSKDKAAAVPDAEKRRLRRPKPKRRKMMRFAGRG